VAVSRENDRYSTDQQTQLQVLITIGHTKDSRDDREDAGRYWLVAWHERM